MLALIAKFQKFAWLITKYQLKTQNVCEMANNMKPAFTNHVLC